MSNEHVQWLLKVIQPERSLAALPGGGGLGTAALAGLLGIPEEIYTTELNRMRSDGAKAAEELSADQAVPSMLDHLPLRRGTKIVAFGDSLTSDPQSWAMILKQVLAKRLGDDAGSLSINAVAGDTTTHSLVRIAGALVAQPDWIIFLLGTNDARTQGPNPTKTLVHHEETARNLSELRQRVSRETSARCIWITPPAVNEEMVAAHGGLARFGVRYRNQDVERVAKIVRETDDPVVDAFNALGTPPAAEFLMGDGLHFTAAGQKRIALEVIRAWSMAK